MPKFKIVYGISRGDDYEDIIEAENLEEAHQMAYDQAFELFNSEATYYAEEVDEDEDEEDA